MGKNVLSLLSLVLIIQKEEGWLVFYDLDHFSGNESGILEESKEER